MRDYTWWKTAVFYQVYPRSFADGNGDGIGDLKGMVSRLDYLQDIGVDVIWLSPHFPSPNWDWGYDISDYCDVAGEYGTLEEFKVLLSEAHARGIRLILDLVLNHTSDQHAWFLESKSSRDNPRADWYMWHDPTKPINTPGEAENPANMPNNWQSCFDGAAWTWVPERGQYYYHYFMKQQPDLNWKNPKVKEAMWKTVRFWLDMGVDGFRLDALGTIFEDEKLTPHNVPMNLAELRRFSETAGTEEEMRLKDQYWNDMFKYQWGGPGLHDLMKELRSLVDEYEGGRLLVGEDDNIAYMGNGDDELHMVFNFPLMRTERMSADHIRQNQQERLAQLQALPVEGWPCNTLGNHDCSRLLTRYGDKIHNSDLARLNAALVLTLRGTPFLYYGEEIGMADLSIDDPARLRDTMATWYYQALVRDLKVDPVEAALRAGEMTRDKNRTPMQWSSAPNAGFSPPEIETWLPLNPNHAEGINVRDQQDNPASLLNYYKRLIAVRRQTPALVTGDYTPLPVQSTDVFAFLRQTEKQTVLCILNYSAHYQKLNLDIDSYAHGVVLFSSAGRSQRPQALAGLSVAAFEVLIVELRP
jgi:alpha-glucosidase